MAYFSLNCFLSRPRPRWFGLTLDADLKRCGAFALDGKELRGSVQSGNLRGEVCVSALAHDSQEVVNQGYYNGTKESERPLGRKLINDTGLYDQKLTLDALHCNPLTVNAVHGAKGVYAVGLKCNQRHLYRYCICTCLVHTAEYERSDTLQRGHGRIDQRQYECFRINTLALAARWNDAGICTLIPVKRRRQGLDGSWQSEQVSYFLSNAQPDNLLNLEILLDSKSKGRCGRIEAMHYRRDVTFGRRRSSYR